MILRHKQSSFDNFLGLKYEFLAIFFVGENMEKTLINFEKAKSKYTKSIGDQEINALFSGLVKIVKRYAITQVEGDLKRECAMAQDNFRSTLVDLQLAEEKLKKQTERTNYLENIVASQQEKIARLLKKLARK